jgi:hypothetical protein
LPQGLSKSSLTSESLAAIESYLTSGEISKESWEDGRVSLTLAGRLVADRIVREILM